MKKGCFFSVILTLTVVAIIIFYLLSTHGEEIVSFGTSKLVELAENEVIDNIDNLHQNEYIDSLKIVVSEYFDQLSQLEAKEQLEKIEELTENIDVLFMDNKVDSVELDFLKKFLKNQNE